MNGATRTPFAAVVFLAMLTLAACSRRAHVTDMDTNTPASVLTGDEPLEPELLSDEFSIDDFSESHDEHEEDASDEGDGREDTPRNNDAPSPWAWLA